MLNRYASSEGKFGISKHGNHLLCLGPLFKVDCQKKNESRNDCHQGTDENTQSSI